jgi:hypothetical protein
MQLIFPINKNFLFASTTQDTNSLNKLKGGLVITKSTSFSTLNVDQREEPVEES